MFRFSSTIKIIIVSLTVLFLSGCTFLSGEKKTEIKFDSGESELSQEKAIAEEGRAKSGAENNATSPETEKTADKSLPTEEKTEKTQEIPDNIDKKTSSEIINKLVSWGYEKAQNRKIDTIIIHSTYNALGGDEHSLEKILNIYKSYSVSPHYVISREGETYRLVKDENIAYHAGVSSVPDGRKNVNNFSIGIEIINTKSESPNSAQYDALKKLLAELKNKYKIKYVLSHSDIAPGRKDDPWNFDWSKIK